jgi:bacterioferritin (cytochrome b1)
MKRIVQANIDRFKQLLETTTDPTKRKTLLRLLAEEEAKLATLEAALSLGKTAS